MEVPLDISNGPCHNEMEHFVLLLGMPEFWEKVVQGVGVIKSEASLILL